MKKIATIIACLNMALVLNAQAIVTSCEQAIEINSEYTGSFAEGEYWFTALTSALPLTLNYYPDDETTAAPQVFLDLTCEYDSDGKGIYRDSLVRSMVSLAENYDLDFPMRSTLKKQTDADGKVFYSILFDRNYRDMLYEQGVTYAIPAYLKITVNGTATINIVSTSINTRCRDFVNDFGMNTSLLIAPDDSLNVYRWQLGEWINIRYRIIWSGDGKLDFYTGKDCQLTKNLRVRDHYTLPDQMIQMTPRLSKEWINDIYATELYVRLYAQSEGLLSISEYKLETKLLSFVVADVNATIDYDNKIIYARLPRGTLNNASRRRQYIQRAVVTYLIEGVESSDPSGYSLDANCTVLSFNGQDYLLDIEFAEQKGSTEATLKSIVIDGDTLKDFVAGTTTYDEVEVSSDTPVIEAQTTDSTATVVITQAGSVPGKATIKVTAVAGNSLTYTLNLIKTRSRNTELSSITVDGEPLAGFTPDNRHYRMYAQSIPVVEAVAADPKSKVVIDQAKGVPGFAQIFVTAEAGNIDTYTINFSIDPEVLRCAENAIPMTLNTPVALQADGETQTIKIPMGKPSLDADSANWTGQRIAFTWSGNKNLQVYVGTTCLFNPAQPDKTLLDSFLIVPEKGTGTRIVYLTPQQTQAWGRQSIDGSLYLRCAVPENGSLTASKWTPNCQNNSRLIDINDEIFLPTAHNSENTYKIYLPDWKGKKVKFSWEGQTGMTMWTSYTCDFKLNTGDRSLVDQPPLQFQSSDELEIDEQHIEGMPNGWIYRCKVGGQSDFLYVRFWTDGYAGTLTTKQTGGPVPPTSTETAQSEHTLSWEKTGSGILLSSTVPQHVQVYSLQGILLHDCQLLPSAPLSLPHGLYIVRGEMETGKVW